MSVRLLYAIPFQFAAAGKTWDHTELLVHAAKKGNINRKALLNYTTLGQSNWKKTPLAFKNEFDDHLLYGAQIPGSSLEFTIEFETSEGPFLDNNYDCNYKIAPHQSIGGSSQGAVGQNVGLVWTKSTNRVVMSKFGIEYLKEYTISAGIAVENRSLNKQVGILLTYDNWKTYKDITASFSFSFLTGGSGNVEIWQVENFHFITHPFHMPMQIAIYFHELQSKNGPVLKSNWDNNFGNNYILPSIEINTKTVSDQEDQNTFDSIEALMV